MGKVDHDSGGVHSPTLTVFEDLDAWGISTPKHSPHFNYYAAYDFVSLTERNGIAKSPQ